TGRGGVPVGLFTPEGLVASATARLPRADVAAAGLGEAGCGFEFPVTEELRARAEEAGGHLEVRVLERPQHRLGRITLATGKGLAVEDDPRRLALCRSALHGDLVALQALLAQLPEEDTPPDTDAETATTQPPRTPPLTRHGRLFDTRALPPGAPEAGLPAYLDYVRYRYRMDATFDVAPGLAAMEHYLNWYITHYRTGAPGQEPRRVPLSAGVIDHLNAPVTMGGQAFAPSRIMWWRLLARPDRLAGLDLQDRDAWTDLVFWWVHDEAPGLYYEDCLVPDRFADLMRSVHPARRGDAYPLNAFLERFHRAAPQLRFLDTGSDRDRQTLVLAVMVMAARRPDLLRYLPARTVETLLERDGSGRSDFERFLAGMLGEAAPRLPRARFEAALRRAGYDLPSRRFTTRTPDGHRLEAAALPLPGPDRPRAEVQLIGPLAKTSGLGQATRLSAEVLRATGLDVRGVDFDLDNPAPEGFSSDTMIEPYGPARINILHLNAESVPLAYAYQPDVFSGAYNIGYFFWELDRPALCHYLGMELLDEIWVSTEYGVSIYRPDAGDTPVVNVGMCYEEHADITREAARAFVNRRFGFDDSHYVCLVAFDSFSFVQRKNPVGALEAFRRAFPDVPGARLVVKTQNRDNVLDPVQSRIWDRVEAIIAEDPRIVVLNETLTYRDLLHLKAGSDCYLSLHKSEGWGFGMIEAMGLGVPVVCTAYSGNMDFCSEETAWLVDYEEKLLAPDEYIVVREGSRWAEPDVADAARQLRAAHDAPEERAARVRAARANIRAHFTAEAVAKRYGGRLRQILSALDRGERPPAPQDEPEQGAS
ncbi:glycosyltransferase, partial [Aquicoccus sp. SCR17]|nr:glycosyltransferase [Carideicomes alvinocaridis]